MVWCYHVTLIMHIHLYVFLIFQMKKKRLFLSNEKRSTYQRRNTNGRAQIYYDSSDTDTATELDSHDSVCDGASSHNDSVVLTI